MSVSKWTVDDALLVAARFADWLGTGDAARISRHHVWKWPDGVADLGVSDLTKLAKESNHEVATAIPHQDPIWCDPNVVDLLAVATAVLPQVEHVEPWQLPTPVAGLVVFSKPLVPPTGFEPALPP